MHIRFKDNTVLEFPQDLPTNWGNISNFYTLTVNQLAEYDWYPYLLIEAPTGKCITGSTFENVGGTIVETQLYRDFTSAELCPEFVSAWRLRLVCQLHGKTDAINALINSLPEPTKSVYSAVWNQGTEFYRTSPTVLNVAGALGLTPEEIDQYFIEAEAIIV